MRLVFDDLALADLEGIYNWIATGNPAAAFGVVERLFESIEHLARFPNMGHVGRDERTLEWVVPRLPYIVVYEILADATKSFLRRSCTAHERGTVRNSHGAKCGSVILRCERGTREPRRMTVNARAVAPGSSPGQALRGAPTARTSG